MSFIELHPAAWTPFRLCPPPARKGTRQEAQRVMREHGISYSDAKSMLSCRDAAEVWVNSRYHVHVIRDAENGFGVPVTWLSIRRHDKLPIHDWRDMQRIKNELLGPEIEAIEVYPAESRLVDTANQFHLWALPEGIPVPVGWTRRQVDENGNVGDRSVGQRAIEREAAK